MENKMYCIVSEDYDAEELEDSNVTNLIESENAAYYHGEDSEEYCDAICSVGYVREHDARVALSLNIVHKAESVGYSEKKVRKASLQILRTGKIAYDGLHYEVRLVDVSSVLRDGLVGRLVIDGDRRINLDHFTTVSHVPDEVWS